VAWPGMLEFGYVRLQQAPFLPPTIRGKGPKGLLAAEHTAKHVFPSRRCGTPPGALTPDKLGNRRRTHDQPAAASRTALLCLKAPGRFARGKFVARIAIRSTRPDVLHRFYKSKAIPICFVPILRDKHVILLGHKMGRRLRPQTPAFFFVLMWISNFA
jgi:hypothetical protein